MASDATRLDVQTVNGVTVARFVDNRILDEAVIQVVGDQMYRLVDDHQSVSYTHLTLPPILLV